MDRVAVVTGAGGGIGLAISSRLAEDGFTVVATDITLARAAAVASELTAHGHSALAFELDISKRQDYVTKVFDDIFAATGRIDVLVNNAGGSAALIGKLSDFCDAEESTWEWVVNLNLYGTMRCIHAVINRMKEAGYGRIVNLASIAGCCGLPGRADYSAAKAAIIGFSQALAMEVGHCGITVNCVSPGVIERMYPSSDGTLPQSCATRCTDGNWLGHTGTPADVAALVAFLASEQAGYITGTNTPVDGGRTLGPTSQMDRQLLFKADRKQD